MRTLSTTEAPALSNTLPTTLPGERWPGTRGWTLLLGLIAVGLYLGLSARTFFNIQGLNGGAFTYSLDDPYIHLALAESLAHGHYGINPGEFSSPSSSVLWPFLLTPFTHFSWIGFAPLWLNLLAGVGASLLFAAIVARYPVPVADRTSFSDRRPRWWLNQEAILRVLAVVALVFTGNLVGLTFTGMEHTLQVLLAGVGAWAILACMREQDIPVWCLVAVALGPSVRYENLGISVAVALALLGQRRGARAALLLTASVVPPLLFSFYLHHLGLPLVPTSVLIKSRVPGASGLGQRGLLLISRNLVDTVSEPQRLLLLVLFCILAFAAAREPNRQRRFALWGATLAAGFHLLVGRYNWLHRYEVYVILFCVLIVFQVALEGAHTPLEWRTLTMLGCSFAYLTSFREAAVSANQVYRQQFQTARFANQFFDGNVAVNDLGLVSFTRRPGEYVLDLWGLASVEAASQRNKNTPWLENIVRQHHVGLVVIYPLWFAPTPPDWTLLGELCLDDNPVVLGGACVSFYATPDAHLQELQDSFDEFVHTTPPGLTVRTAGHLPVYR